MGLAFNSVEQLNPPFVLVDERVLTLPQTDELSVSNHHLTFVYCLEGSCRMRFSKGDWFAFKPGDIVISPPDSHRDLMRHERAATSLYALRILLDIGSIREPSKESQPETDFRNFVEHHSLAPIHCPDGIDARINQFIAQLRSEAEKREIGYRHAVQSCATQIVLQTIRSSIQILLADGSKQKRSRSLSLVERCREYISSSYQECGLKLGTIAWHLGVSEEYLARLFKKLTGQTVFEYLRQQRLEEAKRLLIGSKSTIAQIASQCGFASASYFTRSFQKEIGLTPSDYRTNRVGKLAPLQSNPLVWTENKLASGYAKKR